MTATRARPAADVLARAHLLRQSPIWPATRDLLAAYCSTPRVLVETILIAAFYAFACRGAMRAPALFQAAASGLSLEAVVSGYLLGDFALRVENARSLLARCEQPLFARALALTTLALRLGACLLLLALVLLSGRLASASTGGVVAGIAGLVADTTLVALLALLLSTPVVSIRARIVFFAWLTVALASYGEVPLAGVLGLARLPLLPVAACYQLSQTGTLTWGALLALLLVAVYVAVLARLATARLARPISNDTPGAKPEAVGA
jgi:hypothetical protein